MTNKTHRRAALRNLVLLTFGMALGKLDVFHASTGLLTVDLSQWSHVVFKLKGKEVAVPVAEIFDALAAERP